MPNRPLSLPGTQALNTIDTHYRAGSKVLPSWDTSLRHRGSYHKALLLPDRTGSCHKPTTAGASRGRSGRRDKGYLGPIPGPCRSPTSQILFLSAFESPPPSSLKGNVFIIVILASDDPACLAAPGPSPIQMEAVVESVCHCIWGK